MGETHCVGPVAGGWLAPDFQAMPPELRELARWVVWKGAKLPFCATAQDSLANVNDPTTWASFAQAQTAYEEGGYSGVGFVLTADDAIVGVDMDQCVVCGAPAPAAINLMGRIGCRYVEHSPSGTGLRGFGYGDDIAGKRGIMNGVRVELYAHARYMTLTGRSIYAGPLAYMPAFSELAANLSGSALQKSTEENGGAQKGGDFLSLPPYSSVVIPVWTLPKHEGERHHCLFELARYIKGVNPNATRQELRACAKRWHELALPAIGTKEFAVSFDDLVRGFGKVSEPFGATLHRIISDIDAAAPLPSSIEALGYGEVAKRLVRVCMALQAHHSPRPFFLSARQAAELVSVHYTVAAKLLSALVGDGLLVVAEKGSRATGKATRYFCQG